jgi:hypothetical protein
MQATLSSRPGQVSDDSTRVKQRPPASPRPAPPVIFVALCGIIWPLATLLIEMSEGFSAEIWIDPIPSVWHVAAIAFAPLLNSYLLIRLTRGGSITPVMLLATAFCIGITAVYWALYVHWAVIGAFVFWMGFGLLPMAPMMTCIATIRIFRFMLRHSEPTVSKRQITLGIIAGISFLLVLEIPTVCAGLGLTLAANGAPQQKQTGLTLLRFFSGQKELVRFASGEVANRFEWESSWVASSVGLTAPSRDDARRELYRATGQSVEQNHRTRRGWDQDRAATHVGAVLPRLGLASSTLEIAAKPEANLTYTEWTMEFANDYGVAQEARSEVQLPPGGVVSRLTLWVNGEEREAAFAGQSQVREAYTRVVARSQDPVLVTMSAPGRVLVQCFPVPARGTMQIRLGITAPLMRESDDIARYIFPTFTHQNFRNDIASDVRVQGINALDGFVKVSTGENGHLQRAVRLSDESITPSFTVPVKEPGIRWTRDTRAAGATYVIQRVERVAAVKKPCVVVVDGSESLRGLRKELGRQLEQLPSARIIFAGNSSVDEIVVPELPYATFKGGADNVAALEKAMELGKEAGISDILWIHGPQPVALTPVQSLNDHLQKFPNAHLMSLQVVAGRNAILEQLKPGSDVETIPMTRPVTERLAATLATLRGDAPGWTTKYEVSSSAPGADSAEASFHIVRSWANQRIRELIRGGDGSEAVRMAQRYQLVTPVSGAVVLETAKQFEEAGLKPGDFENSPTVPEPATMALVGIGAAMLLFKKRIVLRARSKRECRR